MTTTTKLKPSQARRKANLSESKTVARTDPRASLTMQFKELRMPTFRDQFAPMATRAEAESLSYLDYPPSAIAVYALALISFKMLMLVRASVEVVHGKETANSKPPEMAE